MAKLTTEEENVLLPILIQYLKRTNPLNPRMAPKIVDWFIYKRFDIGFKGVFNELKLRKLINFIRMNGLLPVMSSSDGYYISRDPVDILQMAASLESRCYAINEAAKGLRNLAQEIKNEKIDPFGIEDWR